MTSSFKRKINLKVNKGEGNKTCGGKNLSEVVYEVRRFRLNKGRHYKVLQCDFYLFSVWE